MLLLQLLVLLLTLPLLVLLISERGLWGLLLLRLLLQVVCLRMRLSTLMRWPGCLGGSDSRSGVMLLLHVRLCCATCTGDWRS